MDRKIGVALTKAERSLIRRRRCLSCVRVIKRIIKTQSLITRKQFLGSETMTFQVSNIGKVFSGNFYQLNVCWVNPMSSCLVINGKLMFCSTKENQDTPGILVILDMRHDL